MPCCAISSFRQSGVRLSAAKVFLDGRNHPADPNPAWLGHSIGKWDGDTLVVDTIGYNEESQLLGAYPHTEMLQPSGISLPTRN